MAVRAITTASKAKLIAAALVTALAAGGVTLIAAKKVGLFQEAGFIRQPGKTPTEVGVKPEPTKSIQCKGSTTPPAEFKRSLSIDKKQSIEYTLRSKLLTELRNRVKGDVQILEPDGFLYYVLPDPCAYEDCFKGDVTVSKSTAGRMCPQVLVYALRYRGKIMVYRSKLVVKPGDGATQPGDTRPQPTVSIQPPEGVVPQKEKLMFFADIVVGYPNVPTRVMALRVVGEGGPTPSKQPPQYIGPPITVSATPMPTPTSVPKPGPTYMGPPISVTPTSVTPTKPDDEWASIPEISHTPVYEGPPITVTEGPTPGETSTPSATPAPTQYSEPTNTQYPQYMGPPQSVTSTPGATGQSYVSSAQQATDSGAFTIVIEEFEVADATTPAIEQPTTQPQYAQQLPEQAGYYAQPSQQQANMQQAQPAYLDNTQQQPKEQDKNIIEKILYAIGAGVSKVVSWLKSLWAAIFG